MTNFGKAFGHETTGDITLSIDDLTGNDLPTSSRPPRITEGDFSSLAFKTIQAAIDTLPKIIRHRVDLLIGSGTFDGFYIMGFVGGSPNAKVNVVGSHSVYTPSEGSAEGVAGSGSISSQISKPTGADDWVPGEFRALFVRINSGGGASGDTNIKTIRAISGNSSDWLFFEPIPGVTNNTNFSIVDVDTTITLSNDITEDNVCVLVSDNTCNVNIYNLKPLNDGYMDYGLLSENNRNLSVNNSLFTKSTPGGTLRSNRDSVFSTYDCVFTGQSGFVSVDDVNVSARRTLLENGYINHSKFHNAVCELDAYNCDTNALFVERGNYVAASVRAYNGSATPVKARAIGYFELFNHGLTGENNVGYGFDAFDGGVYDITGADIEGNTNDLLIDGTEETYDELADNGSIIANNTEVRG